MLTPADLAAMRATAGDALPDTASIRRDTLTPDSQGGFTTTEATVATASCRVAALSGVEREWAERLGVAGGLMLTLPYGTDLRATDRVVVGSRTFEVRAITVGSWGTAVRALATEAT